MTVTHFPASTMTDLLFEKVTVGLCLVAPDSTVVRANAEWLRSTGYTEEQVVGESIIDLFPATRDMALAMHARARAGHRVEVPRHAQVVNGRETWWEGSIEPVAMEGGTGLLISARHVANDFKTFYESAPAAFLVLAPDRPRFTILAASDAYLSATKTTRDIIGRGIFDVFPDDPNDPASTGSPARASFERVLETAAPDTMAVQKHSLRRPESEGGGFEERYWSPINTPVLGADGNVAYIHHRVEDVTEFVRHKEQHAEQEAVMELLRTRTGEMEADVLRRARELQEVNQQLRVANQRLAETDRARAREAELAVRTSEASAERRAAELQVVLDAVPAAVFITRDRGAARMEANRFCAEMLRMPRGLNVSKSAPGREAPRSFRAMRNGAEIPPGELPVQVAAATGNAVRGFEFDLVFDDGEVRHLFGNAEPLTGAEGEGGAVGAFLDVTELRRAVARYEQQVRLFEGVTSTTPDFIYVFDLQGRFLYANRRLLEVWGMQLPDVIGKTCRELGYEQWHHDMHMREIAQVIATKQATKGEVPFKAPLTGVFGIYEYIFTPVIGPDGEVEIIAGTTRDVTDRRRAEEDVREAKDRLQAMVDSITDGLLVLDRQWRYTYVSKRAGEIVGIPPEKLVGGCVWDLFPHARGTKFYNEYHRAMETQRPVVFEEFYPEPLNLWLECRCYPSHEGLTVYFHDVTERQRAEEGLRHAHAALNAVSQGTPVLVALKDRQSRIVLANPAVMALLGRSEAEVYGHNDVDWFGPDVGGRILENDRRVMETLAAHTMEEITPGGRVWLSTKTPWLGSNGEVLGVAVVSHDITDRKAMEDALREADRRKDEFLGMLSHELRNPLAPIRNSTYILQHAAPGSEQARRAQNVIQRQTEHLTRLVDDLLDVTRIARNKIELRRANVDLRDVVARAADDFRLLLQDRGVQFDVALPREKLEADADATRITQIVGNLLHNASKFTRSGDTVTLSMTGRDGAAEIRVRDTGVGIDPELLPRVFEAFVQGERTLARTDGGLGLGLALVKGLTELHGGSVAVESAGKGKGAEFIVRIPLTEHIAKQAQTGGVAVRVTGGRRVLVVDDNRDAAESLADLVRMLGHSVEVAFDGLSAIEAAQVTRPDMVLCDIGLPGMDGYEVAKALRAAAIDGMQIVAVSGYAQPEDVKKAIEAGFDAHVAKPCDPEKIARLLE